MKKDLFHYYESDVESVYNAYIKTVSENFNKNLSATPYHSISFGLKYSFKYNMNGGTCSIYFMPYKTGTAVALHYSIAQMLGARYKKHDSDMTSFIEKELGTSAKSVSINMEEFLKNSDN